MIKKFMNGIFNIIPSQRKKSNEIELLENSEHLLDHHQRYNIFKDNNENAYEILTGSSSILDENQTKNTTSIKNIKMPLFSVKKPEKTYIDLEQALEYSGDNSTYPKRVLYLICAFWVFYTSIIMGFSIFFEGSSFYCKLEEGSFVRCTQNMFCLNPYDNSIASNESSISYEFNIFCDRAYLKNLSYSSLLLVNAVSSVFFSQLSEKFGRKFTLILSCYISSLGIIFAGLSGNFYLYWIFLLVAGIGFGGLEILGRIYASEISASRFRVNSNAALNITWAVGQVFIGFLKMFVSNWR